MTDSTSTPIEPERLSLQAAIGELYRVFAHYPIRPRVEGCSHCVSDADNQRLHAQPLRKLSADDLERYACKALTTWGDTNDLKHFLPRLVECVPEQGHRGPIVPEILLGKLTYPDPERLGFRHWRKWRAAEQEAVESFLRAWWRFVLATPADRTLSAGDCLCAVGQAEDNLTPYLMIWAENPSPCALKHLTLLLVGEGNRILAKRKLPNGFWEERPAQMQQVIGWLASPLVHRRLEEAFFAGPPNSLAQELSLALTVQEAMAAWFSSDPEGAKS